MPFIMASQTAQIDSLKKLFNAAKNDTLKLKFLGQLSEICELTDILTYTQPSIKIAKSNVTKNNRNNRLYYYYNEKLAEAYNNSAVFFDNTGMPDSAKFYYNQALSTQRLISNKAGEADILNNLAYMYENLGENSLALENNLASLKIREVLKDTSNMAVSNNNIGLIYQKQGYFNQAITYYLKAYEYAVKTNSERMVGVILNNLGSAYSDIKDYKSAINYYNKFYNSAKKLNNKEGIARALGNIATLHLDEKNYTKALSLYKQSYAIQKEINDRRGCSLTLMLMATILKQTEKIDSAKLYLNEALLLAKATSSKHNLADAYFKLAEIEFQEKNLINSENNALKSLILAQELNYPRMIYKPAFLLKKIYIQYKKYDKAVEMANIYETARDSIYNQDNRKNSIRSQLEVEFINKETELKLLQQNEINKLKSETEIKIANQERNTAWIFTSLIVILFSLLFFIYIQRSKQKQKESEIEKSKLQYRFQALVAQMNPHFIFNAINGIQNYILKKNTQDAYTYLTKFSKLMRLVLNNSQQNLILLQDEIDFLKLYVDIELLRFNNKFKFDLKINEELYTKNIEIPVMLIQPYVENAIWHGIMNLKEEREGQLIVAINGDENNLRIVIEDNGVGREKSKALKVDKNHTSFGMKLTEQRLNILNEITKQNKTQVEILDLFDETKAIGTRVIIQLQNKE